MLGTLSHNRKLKRVPAGDAPRLLSGSPSISSAVVGSPCTPTEAPYVFGSSTITTTYNWQLDSINISGANFITYTPISADSGHTLRRGTTYANGAGTLGPIYTGGIVVTGGGGGSGTGSSGSDYTIALGYGAPIDDGTRTQDPTTDAVAYNPATIYKYGDVVLNSGSYYISDVDFNVGNSLSNKSFWWPCSQFIYVDSTATPGTGVVSTNPATAKANPFSTLNEIRPKTFGAYPTALDVYSVVLFKRGQSWNGALRAQLTKTGYVDAITGGTSHSRIFFGSYGTGTRPLIRHINNYSTSIANTDAYAFVAWHGGARTCTLTFDMQFQWGCSIASSTGVSVGDIMTGVTTTTAQFQVAWMHPSGLAFDVLKMPGSAADFVNGESFTTNNGGSGVIGNTGGSRRVTPMDAVFPRLGDHKTMYCEIKNATGNGHSVGGGVSNRTNPSFNFPVDIIGCEIHDTCTWGAAGAGIDGTGSNLRIIKCSVYDNGRDTTFSHNIYIDDIDNVLIKLNKLYQTGNNLGNHGIIIHGTNVHDIYIDSNWVYRCSSGIGWNDGYSATQEDFTRVYCYKNRIEEVGYYTSGNGQPFDVSCAIDCWIYNNLIINCKAYGNFSHRRLGDSLDLITNGLHIHNNTWIFPTSSPTGYLQFSGPMLNVQLINNIFRGGISSQYVISKKSDFLASEFTVLNNWFDTVSATPIRWEPDGNAAGVQNYSPSQWNTSTSKNAGGGSGTIAFTNFAGGDYTLAGGSVCRSTGTATGVISGYSTDFDDVSMGVTPSIGCYH